jgi:hypothetical protein
MDADRLALDELAEAQTTREMLTLDVEEVLCDALDVLAFTAIGDETCVVPLVFGALQVVLHHHGAFRRKVQQVGAVLDHHRARLALPLINLIDFAKLSVREIVAERFPNLLGHRVEVELVPWNDERSRCDPLFEEREPLG